MQPVALLLWLAAALLAVSLAAVALRHARATGTAVYAACLAISLVAMLAGAAHLIAGGAPSTLALPVGIPWIGAHFRLDALSAFFTAVIGLGGAAASLYAIGYGRHEPAPWRVLPFYPMFLAGMHLVVLADDAFSFLFSWEFMSLASWALVVSGDKATDNVRAGYVYLVMAGFGTLCLLLAFGVLAGTAGGYAFDDMRSGALSPLMSGVVLSLVMLGAGSKAGLVPLHVWLPLAHPAAPSHVSALMSGVMTKVAVYGVARILFDLLGPPSWWWGMPVLAVGGTTAVLGVLYALMQDDLKRVLACSTIENVGLVFVGLGLALAFEANAMPAAAALALTASLFHVLNHAMFKSLMFFGSGAVLVATGARDMERLGGLIHRMPATSALMLVGAVAISALPPLNGFVSEWLAFQAVLLSPELPQWGLKLIVPAVGAMLALAAALAAACFMRVYGVVFLGRPRSDAAGAAREVDRFSLAAMAILAALCVAAGILPGAVIDAIAPVTEAAVGGRMPVQLGQPWLSIVPVAESRSSYNGLLVLVFIAVSATLAAVAIHRLASRRLRRAPAWDCGFPVPDPATQYTASSFAQPIRRVFGSTVFLARETVDMPPPGDMAPARFGVVVRDLAWEGIYLPAAAAVAFAAGRLNDLQFLTIRRYLSLVFGTLVLLLLVLAIWP